MVFNVLIEVKRKDYWQNTKETTYSYSAKNALKRKWNCKKLTEGNDIIKANNDRIIIIEIKGWSKRVVLTNKEVPEKR